MLAVGINQESLRAGDPAQKPFRAETIRGEVERRTNRLLGRQWADRMTVQAAIIAGQQSIGVEAIGLRILEGGYQVFLRQFLVLGNQAIPDWLQHFLTLLQKVFLLEQGDVSCGYGPARKLSCFCATGGG